MTLSARNAPAVQLLAAPPKGNGDDAASGGLMEELLGPRPAGCERSEADAGSRNPIALLRGRRFYMADITRLGEIAMPKLSDNMAPEDRRSINNYLMQLRDQMIYMMQNLDETNFSDTMRDKLVAMGLKVE